MNVHYLQHVSFEGLASIQPFLLKNGHHISATRLYKNEDLPDISSLDVLFVMGGPMGIYDDEEYNWLTKEKVFIEKAIKKGKKVIGICLGAQLIADVLGAQVYKNKYREIGWFPITRSRNCSKTVLDTTLPQSFEVFHWHGDTFDIPDRAVLLASSEACPNQGFIFDDSVLALQFHLETTFESASMLIQKCGNELDNSRYVQDKKSILSDSSKFKSINSVMEDILQKNITNLNW